MHKPSLIACHECDLLHHLRGIPAGGGSARCCRCGCLLYRSGHDSINRSLALSVTGVVLFIIAQTHPFLGFSMGAQTRETLLSTGIYELYFQDMVIIATLVLLTVVVIPAVTLVCLLYILISLKFKRVPRHLARVLRLYLKLKPWGMMEIFMLGIVVAGGKLNKIASILPGVALFAFLTLTFIMAVVVVVFDEHLVWEYLDY